MRCKGAILEMVLWANLKDELSAQSCRDCSNAYIRRLWLVYVWGLMIKSRNIWSTWRQFCCITIIVLLQVRNRELHRTLDIYLVIPPYLGVFHVNLTPEVSNNTPWRIKHRRYHYRHYNKQWFTVCEDLVLIKVTGSLYCLPYSRHWYRKVACTNRSRLLSQW